MLSRPCKTRRDQNPQAMRVRAKPSSIRLHAEDADGATHFLMKTLPKVATEMALHVPPTTSRA